MAKFCNSCGKPVQDGYAFCNHCGKLLPKMPDPPAQPVYTAPAIPTAPVPPQPVYTAPVIPTAPVTPQPVYNTAPPTPPSAQPPVYTPPVVPVSPTPPVKKSKWWIGLVAGVAALAVLLVCLLPESNLPVGNLFPQTENPTTQNNNAVTEDYQPVDIGAQPVQNITRTVMIYLLGSDLETEDKAATLDIQEMVEANIDTSNTRVLLYTGGAKYWHHSSISEKENAIFLLEQNGIKKVDSTAKKNMADKATLAYFINFCSSNYPSDRYSLILWDHGGGPLGGYGSDENYRDDENPRMNAVISMEEIQLALAATSFGKQNKLEMLGFDACLMGSIECAWLMRDYAEYYVASEESEPGCGWNYLFLENLSRCQNGAQMGQLIIDTYFDFCTEMERQYENFHPDLTLSCVNLSHANTVETALNALFANVNAEMLQGQIGEASRCRYRTKAFGKTDDFSYDLIDLNHIATLLQAEYPAEAEALLTALNSYVTYNRSNLDNAYGVSIYHPYDNADLADVGVPQFQQLDFARDYATYINNFVSCVINHSGTNTAYRDLAPSTVVTQENKSDLSLTLTSEQMATFAGAEYYVFYALDSQNTLSGDVEYWHVFSGQDYTLSKDGVLSATYDGKAVFALENGDYTFTPLAMNQIYDGSGDEKFYLPCTFHKDNFWSGQSEDAVNWMLKIKDGKPILTDAYLTNEDGTLLADKVPIDSEDYDYYRFSNYSYTMQFDPELGTQIYHTGYTYYWELAKGTFELELRPLTDRQNYYAVFAITDIYGNLYFSDVTCLGD